MTTATAERSTVEESQIVLTIPNADEMEPDTIQHIQSAFGAFYEAAAKWVPKAKQISVTDASQVREMKLAHETRMALREIRIDAEKTRKRLKQDSLLKGRAIDGAYNILEAVVKPAEDHLKDQEDFIQRQEEKRQALLNEERTAALQALGVDASTYASLGVMPDQKWAELLETHRLAHQARIDAARRADEERIEREKEAERVRQENERLRAEAAEKEAALKAERERVESERRAAEEQARKEREALEAKARAEREALEAKAKAEREAAEAEARRERAAREKLEAEARAREEAERKRLKAEAAAQAKAARAPDKQKVLAFAETLRTLQLPEVKDESASVLLGQLNMKIASLVAWINAEAATL